MASSLLWLQEALASTAAGISKTAVQHIVRETLQQSGVRPNVSSQQYAKVASLIADAVATLSMATIGDSKHDEALQNQPPQQQQITTPVASEAKSLGSGENARALLAESESGEAGWPFTAATKNAIEEARSTNTDASLERLLGLHLALGLQCRITKEENETLHSVIDHMKDESTKRQRQQQEQINTLKSRLAQAEKALAAAGGLAAEQYAVTSSTGVTQSEKSSGIIVGVAPVAPSMQSSPRHEFLPSGKYKQLGSAEFSQSINPQTRQTRDKGSSPTTQHLRDPEPRVSTLSSNSASGSSSFSSLDSSPRNMSRITTRNNVDTGRDNRARNAFAGPNSPNRNKKKLHMTVSRQARARKSIREALLHLADQNGQKGSIVNAGAIHQVWLKVFQVHSLRGETSLGLSEFRRALRVALNIHQQQQHQQQHQQHQQQHQQQQLASTTLLDDPYVRPTSKPISP